MHVPPPALSTRLGDVRSSPVRDILELTQRAEVISFAGGLPAPELFPAELIADAFARALAPTVAARALQYSSTEGDPGLRALLAERFCGRGLACDADELLVTTGSQQALGLISAVLIDPGDVVLVENPSYLAALQSFGFAGARLVPVPCDEDGLQVEALPELIVEHAPKFLYVVPTFQNPTGRTLPAARRARLAEIAAGHGLWIVEDDPYGELRYDGRALTPIGAQPGAGDRTVTISSLSKVLAPGLRIGWLRAPEKILRPLAIAKQAADLHTSTVDQIAARTSLQAADLDTHIDGLRREYRRRRDALLRALARHLGDDAIWTTPRGGHHVFVTLLDPVVERALYAEALRAGVTFLPGGALQADKSARTTMRLSFGLAEPAEHDEAMRRLALALREVRRRGRSAATGALS
jgi:2-aminoadipate transaminase